MRNKIKRILKSLLVISLIFGISPVRLTASEATESKTLVLINEKNLIFNVTLEQNNKELLWKFNISKNQETDTSLGLIAFVDDETIEFEKHSRWQLADDDWFYEASSKTSQDLLVLKTSVEVESIKLKFTSIVDSEILPEKVEVNIDADLSNQEDVAENSIGNANHIDDSNSTEIDTLIEKNLTEHIKVLEFQINKNELLTPIPVDDKNIVDENDIDLEYSDNQVENKGEDLSEESNLNQSVGDESVIFVDSLDKLELIKDQILNNVEPTLNEYTDPFDYITDQKGRYPNTGLETDPDYPGSKTTVNFNYGLSANISDTIETKHAYGSTIDFNSGYHNHPYGEGEGVLTKKTVKPTTNPNRFDLEVDIIGGATPVKRPVDIVLIVDDSASMNKTPSNGVPYGKNLSRWTLLTNAVKKLANDLLDSSGNVQMAMTTFGSDGTNSVFSKIPNFGSAANPVYFTGDSNRFVKNNSLDKKQASTNSGTPTFMGIETAFYVMNNYSRVKSDPNVKTYIILLTDGVSTFGRNSRSSPITGEIRGNFSTNGSESTYRLTSGNFTGTGTEGQSFDELKSLTNTTLNRKTELGTGYNHSYIGLGFGQQTDKPKEIMKILLEGFSSKGQYFDATTAESLNKVFEIIKRIVSLDNPNFNLGQLIDPMSEFIEFIDKSFSSEALSLNYDETTGSYEDITSTIVINRDGELNEDAPLYAKDIKINYDIDELGKTTGIHLKEMNLGVDGKNRMGYRIKYTVELKEGYRDGKFYPANGPTRAIAFNYDNAIGMAVPSIRVPVTDFEFLKVGQDNKPLEAAKFELYKKVVGSVVGSVDYWKSLGTEKSPKWGVINFSDLTHGRYRLVETESPDGYQTIDPIEFDIVQGSPVKNGNLTIKGLESLTNSQGEIVIKNLLEDFILQVEKLDNYGNAVQEVTFRLEGNGINSGESSGTGLLLNEFKFSGLRPGTYTLTEIKNPDKYVTMDPVTIVIKDDGTVSIDDSFDDENFVVEANIIKFKAINILKGILPSTGGSDMMMFKLVPVMLLILAGSVGLFGIIRQRRYQTYED